MCPHTSRHPRRKKNKLWHVRMDFYLCIHRQYLEGIKIYTSVYILLFINRDAAMGVKIKEYWNTSHFYNLGLNMPNPFIHKDEYMRSET